MNSISRIYRRIWN